jgi:hypothetical protein
MRTVFSPVLLVLAALLSSATAQFGFFDQMFGGGGGGGDQRQQAPQNVPSDSSLYQQNFDSYVCDKYLCPDTLGRSHPFLLSEPCIPVSCDQFNPNVAFFLCRLFHKESKRNPRTS